MDSDQTTSVALNQEYWRKPQMMRNQALIALVQTWSAEDAEEDPQILQAAWEALKQLLDEDRLPEQRLFS